MTSKLSMKYLYSSFNTYQCGEFITFCGRFCVSIVFSEGCEYVVIDETGQYHCSFEF